MSRTSAPVFPWSHPQAPAPCLLEITSELILRLIAHDGICFLRDVPATMAETGVPERVWLAALDHLLQRRQVTMEPWVEWGREDLVHEVKISANDESMNRILGEELVEVAA